MTNTTLETGLFPLTTPRLSMRPMIKADWPLFHRLHTDNAVIEQCFDPMSLDHIEARFKQRLTPWSPDAKHWLCLVIVETATQTPIGITGFLLEQDIAEVGYLLLPPYHGCGYGTESLLAVTDFAIHHGGARTINATVTAGNLASARVLEKVGFHLSRIEPDAFSIGGICYDDWIYTYTDA
ncbi:GNAT family N-acetyltransferase [Salinivibrio socompensis]|uniref:GNAT family N-acetyltransferase n=1 Tax=Salinivibrio socompensis TaxID=1510206 RepID=UPI000687B101|nr:GNAT family N-acetyltransferase [Salinivibrio socompensis]